MLYSSVIESFLYRTRIKELKLGDMYLLRAPHNLSQGIVLPIRE